MVGSLNAQLIELIPATEYQGKTYQWRAILQLDCGSCIGVFDPDLVFSKEQIGEDVDVVLSLYTVDGDISIVKDRESIIIPNENNKRSWKYHTYIGNIIDIFKIDDYRIGIWLQVGAGSVFVDFKKNEVEDIEIGDLLKVKALRTDVQKLV